MSRNAGLKNSPSCIPQGLWARWQASATWGPYTHPDQSRAAEWRLAWQSKVFKKKGQTNGLWWAEMYPMGVGWGVLGSKLWQNHEKPNKQNKTVTPRKTSPTGTELDCRGQYGSPHTVHTWLSHQHQIGPELKTKGLAGDGENVHTGEQRWAWERGRSQKTSHKSEISQKLQFKYPEIQI